MFGPSAAILGSYLKVGRNAAILGTYLKVVRGESDINHVSKLSLRVVAKPCWPCTAEATLEESLWSL